ncbi:hypothetical protein [Pantoea dispersa]|uniref:hypothetical protein n=1 Tax=Pantoea dispersa TaxID=59814 RepID=UPI000FDB578B|nr:hypothetical protein [Pantoea dispersa]RVU75157.1 hypothetical protein EKH82_11735 [Pantoea dispersa]
MKDFKIEYRDGKLLECRVDGVLVECLSSLHLVHEGKELPTLTITTHVSSKETLIAPDVDRKTLESVTKRFGDVQIPFGGFPGSPKRSDEAVNSAASDDSS